MIDLFLRNIALAHKNRDISKLERLIKQLLNIAPIPIVDIQLNIPFQRLKNNYKGEIFNSEEEISFRNDYWNIKEFGRANFPNSSKFYASLNSKYIDEIRFVNVLETNKEFRENKIIRKRQIFTSGEWITKEVLSAAIFPFDRNAILHNDEIKFHSEKFDSIIKDFSDEQRKWAKKVLQFISYYYSLKYIQNQLDYSISAFISELLFDKYNLDGILYPGIRAKYKTYNIVLQPRTVLTKLRFANAAMFELLLNRKIAFIDNVAYVDISYDRKLYWNYTERTTDKMLNNLL